MVENSQPHSTFDDAQSLIDKSVDFYKKGKKVLNSTRIITQTARRVALRSSTSIIGPFILSIIVLFIMTIGLFFLIQAGVIEDDTAIVDAGTGTTPISIEEVKKYIVIDFQANSGCFAKSGGACDPSYAGEIITDPSQQNIIYNTFALPLASQKFRDLFQLSKYGPIHIYFFTPIEKGYISGGGGYGTRDMAFFGFFEANIDLKMKEHILVHESAHVLDQRNGRMSESMPLTNFYTSDPKCYDGGFLSTYPFRGTAGGNGGPYHESFADAVANNVYCAPGEVCDLNHAYSSKPINDYPNTCKNTYGWIKQNVFGGTDFFSPSQTPPIGGSTNDCSGAYASWFKKVTTENQYQCTGPYATSRTCSPFLHNDAPNFGDSSCTLYTSMTGSLSISQMDDLSSTFRMYDPANVRKWLAVAYCESRYHANSFNPNSASHKGAYGLVQMNPSGKGNGIYDAGDVEWKKQIENAVNYKNKTIGGSWAYWACAK